MNTKNILLIFIILFLLPFFGFCQVIESEKSTIHINNKKDQVVEDKQPPSLELLSPVLPEKKSMTVRQENLFIVGKTIDNECIPTVLLNSKEIIPNPQGIFREKIKLKEGLNTIKLLALDDANNVRELRFEVNFKPFSENVTSLNVQGDYYALIIGINDYEDPNLFDLTNPIRDSKALYELLTKKYTFHPDNITYLKNARRYDIITALDKLGTKITPKDNLLIFYAGHGWWDENADIGYWLPADADKNVKAAWVRNSTVRDYLKEIESKHTLLITDACFAGSILKTRTVFNKSPVAIKKMYMLPSRKAMTSGTLKEVPDESVFVKYMLKRLDENDKKFLPSDQLFQSFKMAVINNSNALPQYGVIKNVGDEGGEFIFIKK